uniref:Uncharacterized protein n=1 Tax=viral metagenome TaxID=1070528 RepID=A0A6M3KFE1_9ZZZZ
MNIQNDAYLKMIEDGDRVDVIKIAGENFMVSEIIRATEADLTLRFPSIVVPYAQPEGRMQMSISEWIPSIMVPDWVDIFKCYAMPRINILFQRTASKAVRDLYSRYRKNLLEKITGLTLPG